MKKYIIFLIAMICLVYGYSAKAEEICTKEDGKLICTEPSVVTFQKTRAETISNIEKLKRERQRERNLLNNMIKKAYLKKGTLINDITAEIELLEDRILKMDELNLSQVIILPTGGLEKDIETANGY